MKKLILMIFTILGMVVSGQDFISAPSNDFSYSNDFVNGDVFAMNKGIAGGEFTVLNDSGAVNIYDFNNDRQVGTNADLYMPIEDVLTLSDGSYYTRAIRLSEGDTVLIYTSSHDDEWRVLSPHANVVSLNHNEHNQKIEIAYFDISPVYAHVIYEGPVNSPDGRRVDLYVYNFDTESFDLVYQHLFPNYFFLGHITNISDTEIFWYEAFGSNRLGIWSFDESDKSVERTVYNTIDIANIRIANGFHHVYNHVDNEVLLAISAQEISNNNNLVQGIYRLKLNETISGQRLEKMFSLSSSMSGFDNKFHYVNDSLIGEGYLWYNRLNSPQTVSYSYGEESIFDKGLYLINSQMNAISGVLGTMHNAYQISGLSVDLHAENGKVFMASNTYVQIGSLPPVYIFENATETLTPSNGLLVLDFNEYIEDPIITESVSIVNSIESLRVGSNYSFSASQTPIEVDSPGITWSLEVIEGDDAAVMVDSQLFGLNTGVVKVTATANDNPSAFAEIIVTIYKEIEDTTGVNDSTDVTSISFEQEEISLKLYPNPTTAIITLQNFPDEERLLYNMTGQLVGRFDAMEQSIDISDHPTGMYFLKVGTITEKVIKK